MTRADDRTCVPGPDGRCALCADEAVEARVIAVDADARLATVRVDDGRELANIALDLVDGVGEQDIVLLHQGFVIARLAEGT